MAVEREIKLTADSGEALPDLVDTRHGVTTGEPKQLHLAAVYYDTPTFSMARSGVTLRARTGDGKPVWTLKLPDRNGSWGLTRSELTFDEPLGPIPAEARLAARAYVRTQPLGPVMRLQTERTELPIAIDGRPVATLVDDTVEAEGDRGPVRTFREVEVELEDGVVSKAVSRVVDRLRDAGFRDDPTPKAVRALGERALQPPDVPQVDVDRHSLAGPVVRAAISRSVSQLIEHHAGVWLGTDPEDLHQFRVATRRLRSDLRTLAPLLDQHWMTWLRDELKWLGTEVGMGRDSDVLANRLRRQMEQLPTEDADAVHLIIDRLTENRNTARQHVLAALSSDRYLELLDALVQAAGEPRFATDRPGIADEPGRRLLRKPVRKRWRKLVEAARAIEPDSPDSAFHGVRIRAKQARYAAEAVTDVFGSKARRFAKAVEKVQSVLGDHQDTAVAEAWLRRTAEEVPDARVVVGELMTVERLERLRLREEFGSAWKKASRRKLTEWLD